MSRTQPARGMRDFLPEEVRRREFVVRRIKDVYARYGFEPLETPAVENIETLLGKYGEEGNQLIFKILKRGEHAASGQADLALRYDLTVPLARVVAEYRGVLPKFFKRYQIQPVWRADRPARGRFREFYQCDVDALGSSSTMVEAELCAAVSDALVALGFADFTVRLNDRRLLDAVLDAAGVPGVRHGEALVALDKLDKMGREGVARELEMRGIDPVAGASVLDLFAAGHEAVARGTTGVAEEAEAANAATLARAAAFIGNEARGLKALADLADILGLVASTPAAGHVRLDLALARGLSYYTGAIMEIAVPDLAGSLGGGGRYDELVGMFLGQHVPACGFSLGLERILVVMGERGMFPADLVHTPADVMVAVWNAAARGEALALANEFRTAGLRVDVYPEADKLGKQFKYAAGREVPFVAVVGDDERSAGTVALKDLRSGEQMTLARGEVASAVQARLASPVAGRRL